MADDAKGCMFRWEPQNEKKEMASVLAVSILLEHSSFRFQPGGGAPASTDLLKSLLVPPTDFGRSQLGLVCELISS